MKIETNEILKTEEETVYEKPKRKRHRKKKNKSPVAAVEESYTPKITKNQEFSFPAEKPKVHIKFDEEEVIDVIIEQSARIIEALSEIKENEDQEMSEEKPEANNEIVKENKPEISNEPPRIVTAINDHVKDGEKKELVIEDNQTVSKTKETALETLRNNLNNLDIPLLTELPKAGDIIAFKILAMSENYLPEISDYMIGLIESIHMETNDLKIVIMGKYFDSSSFKS